jgi:hypothetical protein
MEKAIDPVANPGSYGPRLDVNIGGPNRNPLGQDKLPELDDEGILQSGGRFGPPLGPMGQPQLIIQFPQ